MNCLDSAMINSGKSVVKNMSIKYLDFQTDDLLVFIILSPNIGKMYCDRL